ncbi:MAG: malic enzyme-like NAD(P)-binding protein, partial [bacterium]
VFIGVSAPQLLTAEMVRRMAPGAVVLAMANPVPEIWPEDARAGGAVVVGTGRSDYPNQVNNVLAFPGVFRGALDARVREINEEMKIAAAYAIADLVPDAERSAEYIMPGAFDRRVAPAVAAAVARVAAESGVAGVPIDPVTVARRTEMLTGGK